MSGFIVRAACRGRRPSAFASAVVRERAALITRLLKERNVARFIVAPDGYGKTSLALEYAETMFSWAHTFWVNAKSPCFIRDLDERVIAQACLDTDADAELVVFDDLPPLDSRRMEAFCQEIDTLLAARCEVVVTCVPTCDMAGGLQLDRIRLGAHDLLLDDAELDEARPADERFRKPVSQARCADRIPSLAWATDEDAFYSFAKSALYEEMPADLLLAVASVLVLRSGTFSDLLSLGPIDEGLLSEVLRDYPHLGFDDGTDRFEAPSLGVEVISMPIKNRLPELVARSSCSSAEQLVFAWAKILLHAGQADRACDVVREVCPRRERAAWLIGHAHAILGQACVFPMFRMARDQDSCKGESRARLNAIEAVCRAILGDEEGAVGCAKRHAFDASSPADVRICELLVIARFDTGSLRDRAHEALAAEVSTPMPPGAPPAPNWAVLAKSWCTGADGELALARFWGELADQGAGEADLCVCASWLFGMLDKGQAAVTSPEVRRCARYVCDRLRAGSDSGAGYYAASAGLALEAAHNRGVRDGEVLFETGSLIELRKVEMNVLSQRRQFNDDVRANRARRNDWVKTHPAAIAGRTGDGLATETKRTIPILTLRMFGHFEAAIGGAPLDPKRLNRRNARTLLVLLAMNQGRELSRDMVERTMWPHSTEEVAHKSFYTVWSNLRKALTLPDGTCPYLIRHQYGCHLESRYVQSDVERLGEICRELLFGVPDIDKWSGLFTEIDRDFSSDLMPAERKNRLIVQARNEYRTRLVDALVAATGSIIEVGNPKWGIWVAREALAHDDTREDAYYALMRAQAAGGQRTEAIMTFHTCRRVLSEKLGIDPSPEITHLYESQLGAE